MQMKISRFTSGKRILRNRVRFLEVCMPILMDNGDTKTFQGYRAQHNDAAGTTKVALLI